MARRNNTLGAMDIINMSAYTAPSTEEVANKDYILYGENNTYFDELVESYIGSTTSGAIINGISQLIYGKGLDARDSFKKPDEWAQLQSILKAKDLKKIIFDRKLLGMAAMQVQYERGKVRRITHFPMQHLRAEKANSNGEIEAYYYHPNWAEKKNTDKPKRIPAFGFGNGKTSEMYIVKPYVTGHFYYAPCDYTFALPYAYLEREIGDYLINDTINGFSGTMLVNFNNGVPSEEIQRDMKNKVIKNLTGTKGQKVMVNFNKNGETATTIERFEVDDAPDHYQYLSDECRNKLIIGHRITSPLLLGIREAGGGLGSNSDEIKTASLLLDNIVIKPFQEEIIDALDEILALNMITLDLFFKSTQPLAFSDEMIEEAIEEKEEVEETVEEVQEEEAPEELTKEDVGVFRKVASTLGRIKEYFSAEEINEVFETQLTNEPNPKED